MLSSLIAQPLFSFESFLNKPEYKGENKNIKNIIAYLKV